MIRLAVAFAFVSSPTFSCDCPVFRRPNYKHADQRVGRGDVLIKRRLRVTCFIYRRS